MNKQLIRLYNNILYLRFQPLFITLPPDTLNKLSPGTFFRRLLKTILYTGGRLVPNIFSLKVNKQELDRKIWLYVVSQNNYDALFFLKESLPDTVFVAGQNKQIGRYNKLVSRLSLRWKLFYTLRYFIPVFKGLQKIHGLHAVRFFDLIFISIGYYEHYITQIKKHQPKAIIFSNDHNDDARAMLLAAKVCNIPTIYIQHASVSLAFPPLEFDLNLLEGQDTWDKYKLCGPVSGEVRLIGMPKADKYLKYRKFSKTVETIGLSGNLLDNYQALKNTLTELAKSFPDLKIIFRPHPADTRDCQFVTAAGTNIIFSEAKSESAFDYLRKVDLLIAADSSIHLEATLLNIPAIYYRFGESTFTYDYYGYVATGLITEAKTIEGLKALIISSRQCKPDVYQKAAIYNAVTGTENEGKSGELAIAEIEKFLNLKL